MSLNNQNSLQYFVILVCSIVLIIFGVRWITFPSANEQSFTEIDVYSDPIQQSTQELPFSMKAKGKRFFVTPLADYNLSGVIVSTKRYHSGIDAAIVPIDIGICWGEVAKEENLKKIKFQQYLRFLTYRFREEIPFGYEYLNTHAGNVHMVPANKRIKRVLFSLDKNDHVQFIGYLIKITSQNQKYSYYSRGTSLTRNDTGDGACELMWVKQVKVNSKVYY